MNQTKNTIYQSLALIACISVVLASCSQQDKQQADLQIDIESIVPFKMYYEGDYRILERYNEGTVCHLKFFDANDSLVYVRYEHHGKTIYEAKDPWYDYGVKFYPENIDSSLIQPMQVHFKDMRIWNRSSKDSVDVKAVMFTNFTFPINGYCKRFLYNAYMDWGPGLLDTRYFKSGPYEDYFFYNLEKKNQDVDSVRIGYEFTIGTGDTCQLVTTLRGMFDVQHKEVLSTTRHHKDTSYHLGKIKATKQAKE